ncbi:hypothetical protein H0H92_005191 [Tricholoma furcatifolium]|nr:hypothetical protein H0H92_005191 [Tricholoma furcatifolium]
MALAQQLAELALANSQGLLNDDEYRLLRQNLFEQHSNTASLPFADPASTPQVRIAKNHDPSPASGKPPLHKKSSFTANVTTFLKRGSGDTVSQLPPPSAPLAKTGFFPRLQRKASAIFSPRTEDKRTPSPAVHPSISISDNSHTRYSPTPHSPLQSPRHISIPTFPSPPQGTSTSSEIFDDKGLYTSKDVRAAIIATEAEAQRIREAFDSLESSTSIRVAQQNARRLRAPTPEHVVTLLDGSNWRQYSPAKASQSERKALQFHIPTLDTVPDTASERSNSSNKTSLSRSKSISSLRSRQTPTTPVSGRFPPSASSPPPSILRKNSVSSVASTRLGITPNTSLSRSTGHLPLNALVEDERALKYPDTADADSHPEVSEVQRRRNEVMTRYNARLEYLQARLRSAELHEKLLRR